MLLLSLLSSLSRKESSEEEQGWASCLLLSLLASNIAIRLFSVDAANERDTKAPARVIDSNKMTGESERDASVGRDEGGIGFVFLIIGKIFERPHTHACGSQIFSLVRVHLIARLFGPFNAASARRAHFSQSSPPQRIPHSLGSTLHSKGALCRTIGAKRMRIEIRFCGNNASVTTVFALSSG